MGGLRRPARRHRGRRGYATNNVRLERIAVALHSASVRDSKSRPSSSSRRVIESDQFVRPPGRAGPARPGNPRRPLQKDHRHGGVRSASMRKPETTTATDWKPVDAHPRRRPLPPCPPADPCCTRWAVPSSSQGIPPAGLSCVRLTAYGLSGSDLFLRHHAAAGGRLVRHSKKPCSSPLELMMSSANRQTYASKALPALQESGGKVAIGRRVDAVGHHARKSERRRQNGRVDGIIGARNRTRSERKRCAPPQPLQSGMVPA